MKTSIVFLILLFIGVPFLTQAQTPACSELKRWVDKIALIDEFEQDITYTIYRDHTSKEIIETQCGKYIKNKNKVILELFGNLMIQDDKYQVQVNEEDKVIVVADAAPLPVSSFAEIEKWTGLCDIVKKIDAQNHLTGYSLQFKNTPFSELSKAEIWINPITSMLEELILYFNQDINIGETHHNPQFVKPRLHVKYSTYFTNGKITNPIQYNKYFKVSNGKLKPKANYLDWHFDVITTKI